MSRGEKGGGSALRPPLPAIVRQSLSRRRLAYLGTVDMTSTTTTATSSNGVSVRSGVPCPHLSLMRFTYLPDEDAILMSTNVYTKKYDMLSSSAGALAMGKNEGGVGGQSLVALLVHDFADSSHSSSSHLSSSDSTERNEGGEGMYSITLNGTCSVVNDGKIHHYFLSGLSVSLSCMHVLDCNSHFLLFFHLALSLSLSLSLYFTSSNSTPQ